MSDDERLRAAGLRVTQPRLAVLDAVRTGGHLDADAVSRQARASLGRLSRQAVYDILQAFLRAGLIRRVPATGAAARFELRTTGHHHLVCRGCGVTVDVDRAPGPAPCLDPGQSTFLVDETAVTFWGRCPDCRDQHQHHQGGNQ